MAAQLGWGAAAGAPVVVRQTSATNSLYVIQERNPFHTHEATVTARSGRTSATELIEIGPDPSALAVMQTGVYNRAVIYQRGTALEYEVRQNGSVNSVRGRQYSMP